MTTRASGRIFPGFTLVGSGGGGGGTTNKIETGVTILAGPQVITMTLGVRPDTATFFDSNGQVLILVWKQSITNPTSEISVTGLVLLTNVTIVYSANS